MLFAAQLSPPDGLGFHEVQTPEAWISEHPGSEGLDFMKSKLRGRGFHEIHPSAGLDFIKARLPGASGCQKIQKPRRGFFGYAENI